MDASWHRTTPQKPYPPLGKHRVQLTPLVRIALSAALFLACILVLSPNLIHAAPTDPVITKSTFDNGPHRLSYFPDSPVILYHDNNRNVFRSEDEGKTWSRIQDVPSGVTWNLILHTFDPNIAYIMTTENTHYKTVDRGASWTSFRTEYPPIRDRFVLSFHAQRIPWAYYTKDGFDTPAKQMFKYTHLCQWAISSASFDKAPTELIHCLDYKGLKDDGFVLEDAQLVKSQDFFETQEKVMLGTGDRSAIINFVTKESYILAAERHMTTGDMSLYISDDAKTWAKAHFPENYSLRQDSYTILESTPYSLILDVKASIGDSFGSLMISNSNGTYFVRSEQHTNRNSDDVVDFEKVQNIDGVYIINVVDNYASGPRENEKKLRTKITFEAGASWHYIMPPETRADGRRNECTPNNEGSCSLHLHSVTSAKLTPPIFSSKAAPGVVMGVGNVGPYLLPWDQCDTYLSEDGGITWKAVLEHPHKYEFGDMGGLIVAVRDDDFEVTFFQYSADRGKTWHKYDIDDSFHPGALTSDPESTSQKFLLFVRAGNNFVTYQLDLTNVYGRKCNLDENNLDRSDFEKWYARNLRNEPDCLMGVKTWYWRRKADAECMVREAFTDPQKTDVVCPCTDEDFECDYNFVLKDGQCVLNGKEAMPEGSCKKEGDTFLGSSGYRKVPGNSCDSEKGLKKDEPITKTCTSENIPTDISHSVTKFDSSMSGGFHYFLKSSVVMLLTNTMQVWRSTDDGSTWKRVLPEAGRFTRIFIHDVNEKLVYLFTDKSLYVSHNYGESFDERKLPAPPNKLDFPLLDFHPDSDKSDWMLFLGQLENECFTRLYRTQDAGRNWAQVDTWVNKAVYANHQKFEMPNHGIYSMSWKKPMPEIVCQDEVVSTDTHPLQMIYMLDADTTKLVIFDHVVQFYVVEKFLAVAVEAGSEFILHVSMNGHDFATAVFPPNIRVDKNGFNVLQSTTGSLVIDISKSDVPGREYGRLFKSNSNGTYFSLQLDNTNRNSKPFGPQLVDWEKLGGIEGIILANQVVNTASLAKDGEKHVRTLISFNDGSAWNPIHAPAGSDCDDDECYLHLHSVSEYDGPGAVFSASSSVGLVMGVGNVGKYLGKLANSQTYLSRDAGRTWRKVSDKKTLYEFGDEGGVLVLVDPSTPTQEVSFSYDFGTTWQKTVFADGPVLVESITTEPTSRTSKITITGIYSDGDRHAVVSTLDFSNRRECVLDKRDPEKSDFEKWSPFEGEDDRCILGQEVTYWRRKPERVCRVNDNDGAPDTEQANCKCTERDFECDIGFFKDDNNQCQRFGHDPDKPKPCEGTYKSKSGFRKISASFCKDGLDLENKEVERQCGSRLPVESKGSSFANVFNYRTDTVFYFPKSDIAMIKLETHVYRSENDGKDWKEIEVEGVINGLYRHPYDDNTAIIGTSSNSQYLTRDRGQNWDEIKLPLPSAATSFSMFYVEPWAFHPTEPSWMIFMGEKDCGYDGTRNCHMEAFYSMDAGQNWSPLATWVRSCSWAQDTNFKQVDIEGIYCEQFNDQSVSQKTLMGASSPVQLIYSENYMRSQKVLFDSIVGKAIYSDYLLVAEYIERQKALQLAVSMDGTDFKLAHYPANFDIVNPAYTVLDSTTKSVFMVITVIDRGEGSKVGNLFTSNSNGTFFSLSRKYISEGDNGNVDFEKMQGIEGVALMNEVTNPNEVNQGKEKKRRSVITMDNGKSWTTLKAPAKDSDNQNFDCAGSDCTLHLHNYLDRKHSEDMFSSPSAPGMAIGVGNVGATLTAYEQGSTFLTRDAGHSWKEILHGPHQYDFGDQGSIILLFKDDGTPTDHVIYSLDHGNTFQQYEFTTDKVILRDIVTKPGGIGKSFLLFATPQPGRSNAAKQWIYQIDFEGLDLPTCRLDLNDESNDDFERWSLADLRGEACMFGRKVEYFRRIEDHQCFVGELAVNPRTIQQNCQCTEKDFECDYNYEPDANGKCVLIKDAQPVELNAKEICSALPQGQDYYYESIGYRKMAISSCVGDHELFGVKRYCPGKGGIGFFGWIGIILASSSGAFGLIFLINRYRGYFGSSRGSFIRLGNDMYDQIHLPRSSSLPSVNMPSMRVPRSFSRSLGRLYVPDVVYQAWSKITSVAAAIVPRGIQDRFGGRSGYRYQNLSQEPGEVIMDDYFDHYLDDDDDESSADAIGSNGLLGHGDGLQDAQERYRDESDDSDDDGNEELNNMV
ncbi:vacuolar protein sorting/targeting protein PEP1 [Entomortierella lignicola]|nr:vacuolar protein sorting/targeting protein PEP1 [Entomortierella lignicola]